MIESFIVNWALLVALTQVYNQVILPLRIDPTLRRILEGVFLGLIAIAAMMFPVRVYEDAILDGRVIVIMLGTVFAGPVAGGLSAVAAAAFRIYLGGVGVTAGLITIIGSFAIGVFFHYRVRAKLPELNSFHFALFAVANIVLLVGATLASYPAATATQLLRDFLPVIGLFYLLTSWLFGEILVDNLRKRRTQRALKQSETKYRELFARSPVLMAVVSDEMTIVEVNDVVSRTLSVPKAAIIGRPLREFMSNESFKRLQQAWPDIVAGRPIDDAEYELVSPRGNTAQIVASGGVIPKIRDGEATVGYLAEFVDVTELRKSQEREREQREQLYQSTKLASLGTIVAGVAHEINSPNNFIQLSADNVETIWHTVERKLDLDDQSRRMMAQMVTNIQQGSTRIDRLINDLKDFARSSETERRDPCDVREIIRAACTILSAVIRRATDKFELSLPREEVNLRCNANQIEQVAINLISNACAALRTPSEAVRVTVDRLPPNCVRIQVQDEGNGIEPDMIERLTDPFFTTRQEAGGIGLGLAISERIVADHGGTISFASEAGAGTTVTVLIPELEQDGSILVETRTSGRTPS